MEAEKLNLTDNHFYYILLGELYKGIDNAKAKQYLQQSFELAKTEAEKISIKKKIGEI